MSPTEPLVICTAWNSAYAKIGEICSESILQHIGRVEAGGGTGITFVSRLIPDDYPRPPSWFKLELVRELLATNPRVLWIDCDALLVDQTDIRLFFGIFDMADLLISRDENGLNAGVMGWKSGGPANELLDKVEGLSGEFLNHLWWETAALNKLYQEGSWGSAQIIEAPKEAFNAYTSELCPATRILHFAGFPYDDRIKLMEAWGIAVRRNGWGSKR